MSDGHPAATFTCTIPKTIQFPYTPTGYEIFGVNFGTCSNSNPPNLPYTKISFFGTQTTSTPTPTVTLSPTPTIAVLPTNTPVPVQTFTATSPTPTPTVIQIAFVLPTFTPAPAQYTYSVQNVVTPSPTVYQGSNYFVNTPYPNYPTPTLYPTATPYPSYVVNYQTENGSLTPEFISGYGMYPVATVYPGYPTTTSSQATAQTGALPKIIYPKPGSVLSGKQTILVFGMQRTAVDFYLQPVGMNMGTVYAGRVNIASNQTSTAFVFDTANYPDGSYTVYAKYVREDGTFFQLEPVELAFHNTGTVGESQIIFPSQFDPKKVPVAPVDKIEKVANTKNAATQIGLTFTGKATPNTIITLLIYSNPIVVTVKTDANGTWSYTLEQPLDPGKHAVYAVTPSGGSTVRSEVFNFFIAPGFAASVNNQSLTLSSAQENDTVNQLIFVSIMIVSMSVFVLIILFIYKLKKNELQTT